MKKLLTWWRRIWAQPWIEVATYRGRYNSRLLILMIPIEIICLLAGLHLDVTVSKHKEAL